MARFSVDVREDTRTMHTEVDVPNPDAPLLPGMYARRDHHRWSSKQNVIAVPMQAVSQQRRSDHG